jgi:flagellar biogenesis protein FliO
VTASSKLNQFTRHALFIIGLLNTTAYSAGAKKIDSPAEADLTAKGPTRTVTIGLIDGESTLDMTVVTVRLSEKPILTTIDIQDHGTFLQIPLPGTIAPNPGQFFEGNSPIIKKIAVFQTTPTETALRLFLTEDAALVKSATDAVIMDTRLVITTDHRQLKKLMSQLPLKIDKNAEIGPTDSLLGDSKPLPTATPVPKSEIAQGSLTKNAGINYKDKLVEITVFSGILLILVIFAISLKPLMRKRQMLIQGDSYVPMKLLSNLALAPRQKLSLVQVGNEQILLSISPDKVEFISRIGETPRGSNQQQFQQPQAQVQKQIARPSARPATPSLGPSVKDANTEEETFRPKSSRSDLQAAGRQTEPQRQKSNIKDRPAVTASRGIKVEISDNGIKDLSSKTKIRNEGSSGSIDDVTRMIREKLKNLPSI